MQPKTWWTITLILLAMILFFAILTLIQSLCPGCSLEPISTIITLLLLIALILFAAKSKIGLYLAYAMSVLTIVTALIAVGLLIIATWFPEAYPGTQYLPPSSFLGFMILFLIEIAAGIVLFFCVWKSKSIFEHGNFVETSEQFAP